MGRWEPDARGRLEQAALELFSAHGFDQATAAEIAARAGLAQRTFFRYFADKREVLFGGAGELQEFLVRAVADAPAALTPLEAVTAALEAAGALFEPRREFSIRRQGVIAANVELQERELIKMATLSGAFADVLGRRGVPTPTAGLAAEAGIAIFKIAFQRWVDDANREDFAHLVRASLVELRAVTAGS